MLKFLWLVYAHWPLIVSFGVALVVGLQVGFNRSIIGGAIAAAITFVATLFILWLLGLVNAGVLGNYWESLKRSAASIDPPAYVVSSAGPDYDPKPGESVASHQTDRIVLRIRDLARKGNPGGDELECDAEAWGFLHGADPITDKPVFYFPTTTVNPPGLKIPDVFRGVTYYVRIYKAGRFLGEWVIEYDGRVEFQEVWVQSNRINSGIPPAYNTHVQ